MENADGCGQGQTYDVETLELAWSWLDLRFATDAVAQLWWVKDRQAGKAVAEMATNDLWNQKTGGPSQFVAYISQRYDWLE